MRIGLVCPYHLSVPGGVQGQVSGLARSFEGLGHEVRVFAPTGNPIRLPANGSVAPVTLNPAAAAAVERVVRQEHLDVVHLHEPMAPVLGYACLARHPAPLVGTYHRSGASGWYSALRPVARWANERLDARCAVSEAAAETARAAVGGDFEVLFNGVELERFTGAEPWPTEGPTVLFLGRHEPRKGLAVLLEAFALAPGERGPELDGAVLWVAGAGPETERLRARYPDSERIRWLGVLDDAEVARRLAGADVLCAPSLFGESFGMILLEAMAAGTLVVASDIPGYRAAAGGQAELFPPGDVPALARALGRVLGEVEAGTGRAGAEARAAAGAHARRWSMAELAQRYLAVYERVGAGSTLDGR